MFLNGDAAVVSLCFGDAATSDFRFTLLGVAGEQVSPGCTGDKAWFIETDETPSADTDGGSRGVSSVSVEAN